MKNTLLILLSSLLCFKTAFAQESIAETEKFTATSKIWFFLKYYHPYVTAGKYNWDEELLEILPSVEKASSKEEA